MTKRRRQVASRRQKNKHNRSGTILSDFQKSWGRITDTGNGSKTEVTISTLIRNSKEKKAKRYGNKL